MEITEAKKVLMDYASNRIREIDEMEMLVAKFYYQEKKSMEKLIDILEFSI